MRQTTRVLGPMPGALSCDVAFGNSEVLPLPEGHVQGGFD